MAVDKLVDSTLLDGYFEDIADAIRGKNGSSDTYTPAQMPSAIDNIPSGGDNTSLINLIQGQGDVTIPDGITKIGTGKFKSQLFTTNKDITVPEGVTAIFDEAFASSNITSATLPSTLISLGSSVFSGISSLTSLDFSACTNLSSMGMSSCFSNCSNLVDIDWGNAPIKLGSNYTFYCCSKIKELILPEGYLSTNSQYTFYACTSLELLDLGNRDNGGGCFSNVFVNTPNLKALVIRYTGNPITLYYTSNFNNSGISAGTGYIYVPRASVSAYQAATNWSTYAAQIRAVEDYTDDHTLTGKFIMPT